ncbi:MAG: hypothetical protein GY853_16635 [PVC group bacterium]|nr:hypothetical protein [PVC group bacterium]
MDEINTLGTMINGYCIDLLVDVKGVLIPYELTNMSDEPEPTDLELWHDDDLNCEVIVDAPTMEVLNTWNEYNNGGIL